ncbi:MAG: YdcF family protein [Planctomycetota bacterium]
MIKALLLAFVLPPGGFLSLLLLGFALRRPWPRLARGLRWAGGLLLALASLPFVSSWAIGTLQHIPPMTEVPEGAEAIVVLGGDFLPYTPEYPTGRVGPLSLERLRHGAWWARRSGLPLLVSCGNIRYDNLTGAQAMAECLQQDYGLKTRWIEGRSGTTAENARYSAEMLREEGIDEIVLVTHAWHMPRALESFQRQGLLVHPAPTAWRPPPKVRFESFLPSARALRETFWASHEWVGRLVYRLRGI